MLTRGLVPLSQPNVEHLRRSVVVALLWLSLEHVS